MTTYRITLESIKNLKSLFNQTEELKEKYADYSGYMVSFGDKLTLIDAAIATEQKEIENISIALGVNYNVVVDMAYDFEFAQDVLNQVYEG